MNIDRFKVLLDGYGADPARWPAAERAAAEAFARTSPEAASLIAAARALDRALECMPTAAPALDPVAVAAAASAAPQRRASRPRRSGFGFGFAWPNFAGLAAAMVVGFVVGWTGMIGPLDTAVALADASPLSTTEEVLTW
jgi:hypothetical protein